MSLEYCRTNRRANPFFKRLGHQIDITHVHTSSVEGSCLYDHHVVGPFHIDKLSDEFGQYTLVLKCTACGHERASEPRTLGRLCGWDARLEDVAKRLRCSKCGMKKCGLRAFPPQKPRGYTSLPK
jgi:hypothetical protein